MFCATDKLVYSATRVVYSVTDKVFRERIPPREAEVLTSLLFLLTGSSVTLT